MGVALGLAATLAPGFASTLEPDGFSAVEAGLLPAGATGLATGLEKFAGGFA